MSVRYELSGDTWGDEEAEAAQRVLRSGQFTMGENVERFEREFAGFFGAKYAVMSNSGSSANLLAVAALVYSGRLSPGDEVLVPAVSWSTTYFPLSQLGLRIRLVDIDLETLNIDLQRLEEAVTERSRAVFAVNLLGNPNEFDALRDLCRRRRLILLEDNCESMGALYGGQYTGTFGVLGTFSTFYSHHICTMEGGVTVTDDEELVHMMRSIRAHGWTRQLPDTSPIYQKSENPFYESFQFIFPGYNLRPLEVEAAIGLEQLKKLGGFLETRRRNAALFLKVLGEDERFLLQREVGSSSWFGFALVLSPSFAGRRDMFTGALRSAGIAVRPIVAGNFARQPAFRYLEATVAGELQNADYVHDNGFFVGNHSIALDEQIAYLHETFQESALLERGGAS